MKSSPCLYCLSHWEALGKPEAWLGFVGNTIVAITAALVALFAAFLTYHFANKSKKREMELIKQNELRKRRLSTRTELLQKQIKALESLWPLLEYLGPNENSKSIMVREQLEQDEDGQERFEYFLRCENFRIFMMEEVSGRFFSGTGLFLSSETKDVLFRGRNSLISIFRWSQSNPDEFTNGQSPINNPTRIKAINDYFDGLRTQLVKERLQYYDEIAQLAESNVE